MAKSKFDLYDHVTNQIITALEAGTPPWRKPWTGGQRVAFPLRSNGEAYRGINVLMLWLAAAEHDYSSAHWFTYKQSKELNAQVRKGEKSTTVVKYGTIERENEKGEERTIPYAKAYRVFNADQIEGLPEQYIIQPDAPRDMGTTASPELDNFIAATGAKLEITDRAEASYNRKTDHIHMPPIATFHSAGGYYETLLHELTHWTGHKTRLDRFQSFTKRSDYAFEELIAEIGSCMAYARLGLVPSIDQSAAYIEGWLNALQDDKRLIFKAASAAQKAADLIFSTDPRTNRKSA